MNDYGAIELAESTRFRSTRLAMAIATAPVIPAIIGAVAIHIFETRFSLENDIKVVIVGLILSALGIITIFCICTILYQYFHEVLPRRVVALRYDPSTKTLEAPFVGGLEKHSADSILELRLGIAKLSAREHSAHDCGTVCQVFAVTNSKAGDAEQYLYGCYLDILFTHRAANIESALREFADRVGLPLRVDRLPARVKLSWSAYNSIVCNLE